MGLFNLYKRIDCEQLRSSMNKQLNLEGLRQLCTLLGTLQILHLW